MHIPPYYIALTDFGDNGLGHSCDPASFDDACDTYAEKMADGLETLVFRVDPPVKSKAGAMIDVTDDAAARIRKRLNARFEDFPNWLAETSKEVKT